MKRISVLFILLILVVLSACSVDEEKVKEEAAESVKVGLDKKFKAKEFKEFYDDITIEFLSEEKNDDGKLVNLNIVYNASDAFSEENIDEKYRVVKGLSELTSYVEKHCAEDVSCNFENVVFEDGQDRYEMLVFMPDGMVVNGEAPYKPTRDDRRYSNRTTSPGNSSKPTKSTSNTNDVDTTVQNKSGSDWNSLTENQKFHAVSNALYNLDMNGYTITETEQFYIGVLNEYYSDSSNSSTQIDDALGKAGAVSETINK